MPNLIAVKGKKPGRHSSQSGQRNHLAFEDQERTMCHLMVANKIAHMSPLRSVVDCQKCFQHLPFEERMALIDEHLVKIEAEIAAYRLKANLS